MATSLQNKLRTFFQRAPKKELLAILVLLLAIVFFRSERKELSTILPQIHKANPWLVIAGLGMTIVYILFQSGIYRKSFASIGLRFSWARSILLFLKRNFISVFLPAGSISALAYAPSQIRKAGFSKTQVYQASALFGFAGLLTVVLAGLPIIILSALSLKHSQSGYAMAGIAIMILLVATLAWATRSFAQKGMLYRFFSRKFPATIPFLDDLFSANVNKKQFGGAVLYSMGVELCGILHIWLAMQALGIHASLIAAASAYIAAVLMMVVSPFLRGLGAVEISLVYILQQFGYSLEQSLAVMVLYRLFEFWLPLLAGIIAFAWKGRKLFLRMAPALLTFTLGMINIVSVVLPPVRSRLHILHQYLPVRAMHASNLLVLYIGLGLLITAAFLLRGLRSAWLIAVGLSFLSLVGHVTKALDYEEAIIAAITLLILLTTSGQYRSRSSYKWIRTGLQTALLSMSAVLLFGFLSFYFVDQRHFGVDFTWRQSLLHTLNSFLLVEDSGLHPVTRFGHEFIAIIRIAGFLTWAFLLLTLIIPYTKRQKTSESIRQRARFLLSQYGNSAMDYFKVYKDKLYFFSDLQEAFIAYRIAGGFAVVLEEPVCAEEHKTAVLQEFDQHCKKMGLKTAFYRVNEDSISYFRELKKKKLMIGQEGILELAKFSLEGRDKKSLRNGLNNLQKKGFTMAVHAAPHTPDLVQQLRRVSDNWLQFFTREEMIFAQGMFDEKELMLQDIITVSDAEGRIVAFLNIIPDYAEEECTYDLIRKTGDAPAAAADALILQLIEYARGKGKLFINLGMVPLTGLSQPDNTAEQILKMVSPRVRRFRRYDGLREFKEKYATFWENKYLLYEHDFDLFQLPNALRKVMRPVH
ncbi:lysylphosphatidylglycerol synthetase family protein [Paraflavitalea soli]|uniref:Phosphatidylglycerol lysyltransferase n=1 Tax=Paraflavitalea soli TaxID=2315862 RepID=A0A3B7MMJ3_9BACT|nr:flippase-like domain-containing protein [Paraflavitalea soli]AXY72835.1 lysylphosphatidylglycerol synthetase family protein [Paraflavitalea soli]